MAPDACARPAAAWDASMRWWAIHARSVRPVICSGRGGALEQGARGGELSRVAQQQNLIADLQFLIGARVDDAGAVAFDADDAGAGHCTQSQLANQFSGGRRGGGDTDGFEVGVA